MRRSSRRSWASDKFVPVYSDNYFRKEMCRYELSMPLTESPPAGWRHQPHLIDPSAHPGTVAVKLINVLGHEFRDWFEKLGAALELTAAKGTGLCALGA